MKIAIIGANEFQTKLILKCKENNIETHVFFWFRLIKLILCHCGHFMKHFFLTLKVSNKKSVGLQAIILLTGKELFSSGCQIFFLLYSFQPFNYDLFWGLIPLSCSCLWFFQLLESVHLYLLPNFRKFQQLF